MRLPPAVDAVLHPSIARVVVPHQLGGMEAALVLLVAPSKVVLGALLVVGRGCVDVPIGRA